MSITTNQVTDILTPTGGNLGLEGNLVLPKTSGLGIKVDTVTPTYSYHDLLGQIVARGTGPADPQWVTYQGNMRQYEFHVGDEVWVGPFHVPHDWVAGQTAPQIHVHWSHTSSTVTTGAATFGLEVCYAKGYNQAQFGTPVTTTVTQNAPTGATGAFRHMIAETALATPGGSGTLIDSSLIEVDGLIMVRCYLSSSTIDGGVTAVFVHTVDIHYESLGGIGTKNKNFPFYT